MQAVLRPLPGPCAAGAPSAASHVGPSGRHACGARHPPAAFWEGRARGGCGERVSAAPSRGAASRLPLRRGLAPPAASAEGRKTVEIAYNPVDKVKEMEAAVRQVSPADRGPAAG